MVTPDKGQPKGDWFWFSPLLKGTPVCVEPNKHTDYLKGLFFFLEMMKQGSDLIWYLFRLELKSHQNLKYNQHEGRVTTRVLILSGVLTLLLKLDERSFGRCYIAQRQPSGRCWNSFYRRTSCWILLRFIHKTFPWFVSGSKHRSHTVRSCCSTFQRLHVLVDVMMIIMIKLSHSTVLVKSFKNSSLSQYFTSTPVKQEPSEKQHQKSK